MGTSDDTTGAAINTGTHGEPSTLIDIGTLAERLGVTERFVRRLVEERRVSYHKIGKFIRFDPDDINRWVASKRINQAHDD